ncbi:MAG: YwiC-like family protein [Chloroflexi bacterium]|nr:YwiC-like family protein [Chloroflexota bacterium]
MVSKSGKLKTADKEHSGAARARTKVHLKAIAIPAEHGGWGMVLEPILLGLLVVPSVTGLFLALAILASFLARTPMKIVWKDTQRGRRYTRTKAAAQVLLLYSSLVIIGFTGAILVGGIQPILPLLLVAPLIILQIWFDLFSTGRKMLPELMGPVALAAVAGGMALAAGWSWPQALALWAIPVLRAIPSILYVRARLRLEKNKPVSTLPANTAHFAAFATGMALARGGLIPLLATAALFILLARAVYGLSSYRRPASTKTIGWSEICFGLLTVVFSAIGYWIG